MRNDKIEALVWLNANKNDSAFASNRFGKTQNAIDFVKKLYAAGAEKVVVTNILDEESRIKSEGGPYADTLLVTLPEDMLKRAAIINIFNEEVSNCYFGGEEEIEEDDGLIREYEFWWD